MNVPTMRYVAGDLADFGRGPLVSRRCWLAVPVDVAPHVLCRGCGERFETLTQFEWHLREQELAEAIEADIAAEHRRRARARSETAA